MFAELRKRFLPVSKASFSQPSLEQVVLIALPLILFASTAFNVDQPVVLTLVVMTAASTIFLTSLDSDRSLFRQIAPTLSLAAVATVGRMLFASFPSVKPVTALCVLAGILFGKQSGFMVGTLAALLSNFFFGQGPWTPFQMYAWGMVGYLAGVLAQKGVFDLETHGRAKASLRILVFGALASLLFGAILNSWYIACFGAFLTGEGVFLAYGAGLAFDIPHAIATVGFLSVIAVPWQQKFQRLRKG